MQSRNLIVLMFLSLVFLSPLFVIAESDPYDDDTWYNFPSGVDYDVWVEFKWGDKGDLIYWYIEVSGKIRFYFTNSSKDWADPIFSTVVEAEDSHEYNIALPYDDTFYFLMVNQIDDYVDIDGWYARDETGPDGDMWGLNTNFADEVLIGSIRDINCMFSDRFDIVNISLCENDVSVRTCTEPVDNMIEWTISDYKFTTLGVIEMAFKAKDQGGNIGIVSKTIKVVNKLSSPPAHSEPEYFDWVGIFEDYWYVMIPVGTLLGVGIILGLEKAGKLH